MSYHSYIFGISLFQQEPVHCSSCLRNPGKIKTIIKQVYLTLLRYSKFVDIQSINRQTQSELQTYDINYTMLNFCLQYYSEREKKQKVVSFCCRNKEIKRGEAVL